MLPTFLPRHRTPAPRRRRASKRLFVERLEPRTLLSVDLLSNFMGQAFADKNPEPVIPPDTHLAVSQNHIVEVINNHVSFYNKHSGKEVFTQSFEQFFAEVGAAEQDGPNGVFVGFDPKVAYDELAGRFIITALEANPLTEASHLLFAVSDNSNPVGNWEKHRIDAEDADKYWADWTALGWDADAYYVTVNMFGWDNTSYHHHSVFTFDKDSLLDGDNGTLTYFDVDRNAKHFTMWPALMHGAEPGDPMYFVEGATSGVGSMIRVVRMTDKLTTDPSFADFIIHVPNYRWIVNPTQPDGGDFRLENIGTRILSAAWRNDRLVAGHHVGADGGVARARWYEIDTSGAEPILLQSGEIDPGPGIHTYLPSLDIAPNGDLGMTYAQSSTDAEDANGDGFKDGYLSMYITGRKASDPLGVMQPPVLVKAGEATYAVEDNIAGFDIDSPPYRVGDFSGIVVDPVDGTFWAANEYATEPAEIVNVFTANYGTWIANFSITAYGPPALLASNNGGDVEAARQLIVGQLGTKVLEQAIGTVLLGTRLDSATHPDADVIPDASHRLPMIALDFAQAGSVELLVDVLAISEGRPPKLLQSDDRDDISAAILLLGTDELWRLPVAELALLRFFSGIL